MTDDTKTLLKNAGKNGFSIAGYVSTAATFFPIGNTARTYVLWVVLVLIIVGVFRSAQALTAEKNKEIAEAGKDKDRQVEALRTQKDIEIAALNERIAQLSRKPYAEDLERSVREMLDKMSDLGRRVLLHLLKHEPIEVGRTLLPDATQEAQHAQLGIAIESGVVRHLQERVSSVRTYWVIEKRFRPVLEDLLYE
jgi:hypothetical protein